MSDILTPLQRERLAAMERERIAAIKKMLPPDRTEAIAKRGGAIGCLLMLGLLVALVGALTVGAWRWAIGG